MRTFHPRFVALCVLFFLQIAAGPTTRPEIDLNKQKTLYVVGYAHLDTQWRWAYPQTIREYVRNTLEDNFPLIEKFPHYVFNFSGSRRYEFMKEYYPEDYKKLKEYIAQGRWFPCGSSVDENDANVPSAESLIRHVLYGNHFFRREFGVASEEYMLPDCFGFPYALPSVLAHCGIKGFSTQKLTWGSAVGIPFKVGLWEGPDGASVIAALDPGAYTGKVNEDLSKSESWSKRIDDSAKTNCDFLGDYHYYGTGDRGGAPAEESVKWIETATTSNGPIKVVSGPADWMVKTITPEQREKLPRYKGELLLTEHSAGSITSQSFMKRMNRKNELLADAAERASVLAMWMGGAPYPSKTLYDAWDLVLGSQMHDILPGTSIPKAYEYSWNDELLAANQFASVLTDAVGAVTGAMDTRGEGTAIALYNPLSIEREDVVECTVPVSGAAPRTMSVLDPSGNSLPCQILNSGQNEAKVCFVAKVPPLSVSIYHASTNAVPSKSLLVTQNSLENDRFKVSLDVNGDVASILDKKLSQEMLLAPARIAFMHEDPARYPAWNMDWDDQKQPPYAYVDGKPTVRIVESGPVRVALEVTREAQGSTFTQIIRLAAGDAGDRVEFETHIDWQTRKTALKASFPFAAGNPITSYGIQVGSVERENNNEKKYEFPHHQWIDLTDASGKFGASVLDDSKYGSDKPDDHTVRLTLIYTPGTRSGGTLDQSSQDIGRHDILYAVTSHADDWRKARTPLIGQRLNQPLIAFIVPGHEGALGKTVSLSSVSSDHVAIAAIKKAEDSDDVIVRLKEITGEPAEQVHVKFARPITGIREVDGQEREIGKPGESAGELVTDMKPFQMRAFALHLFGEMNAALPRGAHAPPASEIVDLPFDTDVVSTDANRKDGSFDADGRTYPAEQLPRSLVREGVEFKLGPSDDGQKNALSCRGQSINLASGSFERAYILAAADGDQDVSFDVGGKQVPLKIQNWTGYVGQWDNRLWLGEVNESEYASKCELGGLVPGFVKPAQVAWFATHRHHPTLGNEPYRFSYLFKYAIDLPGGATSMTLPNNDRVKIFAMTLVKNDHNAVAAQSLHDTLEDHVANGKPSFTIDGKLDDMCMLKLKNPLYWRDSGLHYTLDGTEPTEQSPVYTTPIALYSATTVKAKSFLSPTQASDTVDCNVPVNDRTPPGVTSAIALSVSPTVFLTFSEPLKKTSAEAVSNYAWRTQGATIESASLSEDGKSVALKLAASPSTNAADLVVHGIKDLSPSGNPMPEKSISVVAIQPVYRQTSDATGPTDVTDAKDLPTHAADPWTINLMLRIDRQPPNRTIIAGFGAPIDDTGHGRYLSKFNNGIHFWSSHRDVDSTEQLDLKKWQMLTATYDGTTLRMYKNGKAIGESAIGLADDDSAIHIRPIDPWDKKRKLEGQVRDMTIWNSALPAAAIQLLYDAQQKDQP